MHLKRKIRNAITPTLPCEITCQLTLRAEPRVRRELTLSNSLATSDGRALWSKVSAVHNVVCLGNLSRCFEMLKPIVTYNLFI